jgi:CheY-like chemotaxis protein
MAAVLRGSGFSVVEAADGQAAFDELGRTRVAVILLDLHMVPRDGVWLLEQLQNPPAVILVSAFALYGESDMRRRFSDIVTHFVEKPVAPTKLIALVRDSVGPSAD